MVAVFAITLYMCRKVTPAPPSHHHPNIMHMALSRCPTITHPLPNPHWTTSQRPKLCRCCPICVTVTVVLACSSPSRLLPHTSLPSPTCTAPSPVCTDPLSRSAVVAHPSALSMCSPFVKWEGTVRLWCVCVRARARVYGGWVMTVGTLDSSVLRALGHPYGNARGRHMMSWCGEGAAACADRSVAMVVCVCARWGRLQYACPLPSLSGGPITHTHTHARTTSHPLYNSDANMFRDHAHASLQTHTHSHPLTHTHT
jgi:hypothetical protein